MEQILNKTIERIKHNDYCIGCGLCKSLCPVFAITMNFSYEKGQYLPFVNSSKCTKCGICLAVCPGDEINHPLLHQLVHQCQPEDPYTGSYLKICTAHSTNKDYREQGASGGFVTQLLANLLESKAVDAVLVCGMASDKIYEPEGYLIRDANELYKYQRSVYTNVFWAKPFREIQAERLRIAVVGLPCQLHGLMKAINLKPELREYFRFTIGLFCGGSYNFQAVDKTLSDMNIPVSEVKRIDFRWGEWPGKMRILKKDGREILTKRGAHFRTNYLPRCFFCFDFLADLADVSVGDNWIEGAEKGENIVVFRKQKIFPYLENIECNDIDVGDLYESHYLRSYRHRFTSINRKISNFFHSKAPNIIPYEGIKTTWKHKLYALLEYHQFHMQDASETHTKLFLKLKDIYFHFVMKNESKKRDK
ncbi:MAG: Coenzyme F420 hydrogenase/dehydrogenase, beta subunit C-terminal domain [Candidatus Cloacimonetes bacterium]|nr:Coenzyme F420 hydrogenase/dehydrogenase, beta subunit C-terminal domain [Candidatus Cloacimonadota bacterium]